MLISGKMKYKKAVILTEDKMHELETLLHKYCDSISYKAETINDSEIVFSSLDELLQYDNFESRSLKSLQISASGKSGYRIKLYFEADSLFSLFTGYDETFRCSYDVDTVDAETTIRSEITTFLRKITAGYWLIAKFRFYGLLMLVCFILGIYSLVYRNTQPTTYSTLLILISGIIAVIISFGLIGVIRAIDRCFLQRCFPPVAFAWGEGKAQFEKSQKLRANLFWGFIVAIFASIIASLIINSL